MKRAAVLSALLVAVTASVAADVKTRERSLVKFEGMLGGMMNRMSGQGKDGITNTIALKGSRKASINDTTGQIVDLGEEKIYELDMKKKEYRVTTFAEMRERMKKAQEDMAKQAPPEARADDPQSGKEMEIDFDVKETGEKKTVGGHPARQVIATVTVREKGKKLEEGGGLVMVNDMWLGPDVPALRELRDFDMRYFKAVYGEAVTMSMAQMGAMSAMVPGIAKMSERMQAEAGKLQGTPLMTTMTFESVKSAESMKGASQPPAGGGGLSGALARRMMGNKAAEARSKIVSATTELLSIDPSAAAEDVAIPAGFKEKK